MSQDPRDPVIESPFVDNLGVQLIKAADGASEVAMPLASGHLNTWGIAHGGVTMTLADVALAMAARSLAGDGIGVVTVEMKVNFMQPACCTARPRWPIAKAKSATAKATSSRRRSARSNT
jgi:acyl-coenzyme A thioesterase PaaI-like protein